MPAPNWKWPLLGHKTRSLLNCAGFSSPVESMDGFVLESISLPQLHGTTVCSLVAFTSNAVRRTLIPLSGIGSRSTHSFMRSSTSEHDRTGNEASQNTCCLRVRQ